MTLPKRNYLMTTFTLFLHLHPRHHFLMTCIHQTYVTDISIDVNGVFKLMQELDASKAAGPD